MGRRVAREGQRREGVRDLSWSRGVAPLRVTCRPVRIPPVSIRVGRMATQAGVEGHGGSGAREEARGCGASGVRVGAGRLQAALWSGVE